MSRVRSNVSRVAKNTGYLYAKMGVTMFVSLYTTRLILGSLGAEDFGIFNIVGGTISLLGFLNAAMGSATQRFMSYSEGVGDLGRLKSVFNVSISLHAVIAPLVALMLLIMFPFLDDILSIPPERLFAAKIVYLSLVASTFFTIISVPYDAVICAHENMLVYAIIGLIESFLKLSVAYVCVYVHSDKLIAYGVLMALIPAILLFVMGFYCHHKYSECVIGLRRYFNRDICKEMLGFTGWTFATTSTSMTTQYGIPIIVNHFFGVLLNASIGIAGQLSGMLMSISSNAQKALVPFIVKSEGAGNRDGMIYSSLLSCRLSFFLFALFSVPAMLLMPYLLEIWLVDVPLWAVEFCCLQLIRTMLEQLTSGLQTAINAEGNIKMYSIVRSVLYFMPLIVIPLVLFNGASPYYIYIIWIFFWCILGGYLLLYFCKKNIGMSYSLFLKGIFLPAMFILAVSVTPFYVLTYFISSVSFHIVGTMIEIVLFVILSFFLLITKAERSYILSKIRRSYE